MIHSVCPSCKLRFTPVTAASLAACPSCGDPLQKLSELDGAVGLRLFRLQDAQPALPDAISVALPIPGRPPARS
jgi:hypothetical protein